MFAVSRYVITQKIVGMKFQSRRILDFGTIN